MAAITKKERLQELREQDALYKALDKIFDRDWKHFVKGVQAENHRSNLRLLKVLEQIKNSHFVFDL